MHEILARSISGIGKGKSIYFCYVCSAKFKFGQRKQFCEECRNPVCSKHSNERRVVNDKVRVCEKCDTKRMREEVTSGILKQKEELEKEARMLSEINNRLSHELTMCTQTAMEAENQLFITEKQYIKEEETAQLRIEEEIADAENQRTKSERLREELRKTHLFDQQITQECFECEILKENIQRKNNEKEKKNEDLRREIQRTEKKLKSCIEISTICDVLCKTCNNKLSNFPISFESTENRRKS